MTIARMVELLAFEHACMLRNSHGDCDRCCENCNLVQDDGELHEMYTDVIALLKAQEPRVMTRAELELAKLALVWLDTHRNKIYNGWALCYDIQTGMGITGTRAGITDPSGRVHWLKLDDYGRTWRCWTSRPTDAQREAEPWRS